MKKLILTLMLLCPAIHAFDLKAIKALIAQANHKEIETQRRIRRVQHYLANDYNRQEPDAHHHQYIVDSSWRTDIYIAAASLAVVGCVIACTMNLQNQQ